MCVCVVCVIPVPANANIGKRVPGKSEAKRPGVLLQVSTWEEEAQLCGFKVNLIYKENSSQAELVRPCLRQKQRRNERERKEGERGPVNKSLWLSRATSHT